MSVTGVTVQLKDTQLSLPTQSVGNCALVYGCAVASGKTLSGKPTLITSVDAYTTWANGTSGDAVILNKDPHLAGIVGKFYEKAGNGTYLWLLPVVGASGDFVTPNKAIITNGIRFTASRNVDDRPRIIGWASQANDTTEMFTPSTLKTTISSIQTIQTDLFAQSIRFVNVMATTVDTDNLGNETDLGAFNAPTVACLVTTSLFNPIINSGGVITSYVPLKDVGEAIGTLSSIPVSESIGSCARTPVTNMAFFNDAASVTSVTEATGATNRSLASNQYLFHRVRFGRGIYYNDDATCAPSTQALSRISYIRLGNAICDDAEYFFGGVINTNAPVTVASGDIDPNYATQLASSFYNQYCAPRIPQQCSSISVVVSAKDNNLVSTHTIMVEIKVQPSPNVDQVMVFVMYVTAQQ